MPFASPSAMAALGEVKAAWGLERWKALDAATKTKLWNARRAGEDGWTPPDFTPAVTPSPPRDEDSSSGEEEVVESGRVAGDAGQGRRRPLGNALVAVGRGARASHGTEGRRRAREEALASINLGPPGRRPSPPRAAPPGTH